jgi:L-serine dehydratase
MFLSSFDLFKVGIGPSSSHTVGPMVAGRRFLESLELKGLFADVSRIRVDVYGSLALTGAGHSTDKAIMLGLLGFIPATIDPDAIEESLNYIRGNGLLNLRGKKEIVFDVKTDMPFLYDQILPKHSNGMEFYAFSENSTQLAREVFYSVGGGFVLSDAEFGQNTPPKEQEVVPYEFNTGDELLALCGEHDLSIAQLMRANELAIMSEKQLDDGLDSIFQIMEACIERGCEQRGILPGGLKVVRRAADFLDDMRQNQEKQLGDPMAILDWINLWALAVNEENAAGGRVVTAPTNGAAGIIPAVLRYFDRFYNHEGSKAIHDFLLTAAAIGSLYKKNASISGAEVGCQGEVGVACSMAAAGLAAVTGGTAQQVENAAEIGMEHNLGLTCDPIGGLVQVPCIERNAMGAVKAIDASRLALRGDGQHMVSLDKVIQTMWETGKDMQDKYKETSQGGLAVSMVEC